MAINTGKVIVGGIVGGMPPVPSAIGRNMYVETSDDDVIRIFRVDRDAVGIAALLFTPEVVAGEISPVRSVIVGAEYAQHRAVPVCGECIHRVRMGWHDGQAGAAPMDGFRQRFRVGRHHLPGERVEPPGDLHPRAAKQGTPQAVLDTARVN